MKFAEIKDYIRAEAQMSSDDASDVLLSRLVNDKLRELTAKAEYAELQTTTTLTPVVATSELTLPADFQHFSKVYWNEVALTKVMGFPLYPAEGQVKFVRIAKPTLYVYPYDQVVASDEVDLVYYKLHQFEAEDDDLLIEHLAPVLIDSLAAEISAISDSKAAKALISRAARSYIGMRAESLRN